MECLDTLPIVPFLDRHREKIRFRLDRIKRHPRSKASKYDRVQSLLACGVPITSVVDVGVQRCTQELIEALPDVHHHLFEPSDIWFPSIDMNYRAVRHSLYPVALGETDGSTWFVTISLHGDGIATHSSIQSEPQATDGKSVLDCRELDVRRLDTYINDFGVDFLLKIDVDGAEMSILRGAKECLKRASVVMIEADYSSLTERGAFLEESGFQLIDIIDRVMYGEVLWQCDLVYIRNDLMTECLRPPMFDGKCWKPLP
jgi:FkbM family methyltransferase